MSENIILFLIKTILFLIPVTLILFIYGWINNIKLVSYIKNKYPRTYQNLYGDFFSGNRDPFNSFILMWDFINNYEDKGDDYIRKYKNRIRKGLKFAFIVFIVIFFIGTIIAIIV